MNSLIPILAAGATTVAFELSESGMPTAVVFLASLMFFHVLASSPGLNVARLR
ncbi:MAG: hypothetical protein GJ680_07860 [Alteromonadaceae bacterium]|nr:hypothetical protein [Alteromonadaceae bacterium]